MRKGAPGAALARFTSIEQRFPDYTGKDKLFFYWGEALRRLGRPDEAARYYARVVEEYPASQYAKKAKAAGVPKTKPPAVRFR